MAKTPTTSAAMALLKKWRAAQIEDGREVACELITVHGETHSKQVQEIMAARGLIDPVLGNFWLGAVFNDPRFEWTGRWVFPNGEPDFSLNKAHAWRPMKLWRFKHYEDPAEIFAKWKADD